MATDERSIFTRIIAGEIPADIVFDNEHVIAFRDIAPKAPVHLLVVPKTERVPRRRRARGGRPRPARRTGRDREHAGRAEHTDGEFRLVFNTGASAGQTIFHVHAHVLGGQLEEGTLAQ